MTQSSSTTDDRRPSVEDDSPEINSTGWTLTAHDIERLVAEKLSITPG